MNFLDKNKFNIIISLNQLEQPDKLQDYQSQGANLFELRYDLLNQQSINNFDSWLATLEKLNIPILLTIRTKKQGGSFENDSSRLALFQTYLKNPAIKAIDIEQDSIIANEVIEFANRQKKIVILSNHFFNHCPKLENLNKLIADFDQSKANIFKLAINLNNSEDYKTASEFLIEKSKQHLVILVGMGQFSLLSRLNFPLIGSLASFTHIGKAVAPNQPNFAELNNLKKICYPQ